jgi:hypothetical protein
MTMHCIVSLCYISNLSAGRQPSAQRDFLGQRGRVRYHAVLPALSNRSQEPDTARIGPVGTDALKSFPNGLCFPPRAVDTLKQLIGGSFNPEANNPPLVPRLPRRPRAGCWHRCSEDVQEHVANTRNVLVLHGWA